MPLSRERPEDFDKMRLRTTDISFTSNFLADNWVTIACKLNGSYFTAIICFPCKDIITQPFAQVSNKYPQWILQLWKSSESYLPYIPQNRKVAIILQHHISFNRNCTIIFCATKKD